MITRWWCRCFCGCFGCQFGMRCSWLCVMVVVLKLAVWCSGETWIFGVQVKFRQQLFWIMAATTLPPPTPCSDSIMPTDSITKSSLSHSFNRGRQKPPQITCRCLLRAHNFSIGTPSTWFASEQPCRPTPSAGRPLAILPPAAFYARCRRIQPFDFLLHEAGLAANNRFFGDQKVSFMTDVVLCRRKEQSSWDRATSFIPS